MANLLILLTGARRVRVQAGEQTFQGFTRQSPVTFSRSHSLSALQPLTGVAQERLLVRTSGRMKIARGSIATAGVVEAVVDVGPSPVISIRLAARRPPSRTAHGS